MLSSTVDSAVAAYFSCSAAKVVWACWIFAAACVLPAVTVASAAGAFCSSSLSESKLAFCSCRDPFAASQRRMISPYQDLCS